MYVVTCWSVSLTSVLVHVLVNKSDKGQSFPTRGRHSCCLYIQISRCCRSTVPAPRRPRVAHQSVCCLSVVSEESLCFEVVPGEKI